MSGESAIVVDNLQRAQVQTDHSGQDIAYRSFLIGTAKIMAIESSINTLLDQTESRIAVIKRLNEVKQSVMSKADSLADITTDADLAAAIEEAKGLGLIWEATSWADKSEKQALIDALQITVSGYESSNTTDFMRINRLLSIRSEDSNIFSNAADGQNKAMRNAARRIAPN